MSIFIEVNGVNPKPTRLMINVSNIMMVAPLVAGGCEITFNVQGVNAPTILTVSDDYSYFEDFIVKKVSVEQIKKKADALRGKTTLSPAPVIKPQQDSIPGVEFDVPTFRA